MCIQYIVCLYKYGFHPVLYLLIDIHSYIYNIMFCFRRSFSTLLKTETLFTRHHTPNLLIISCYEIEVTYIL